MTTRRSLLLGMAAAAAATWRGASAAASAAPVRLIVPFPAGGGGDALARAVAEPLSEALGVKMIIDNRPGAAGNVGTRLLARSRPDGMTLGYVTNGILCVNEHLYEEMGFDPVRDLAPVGRSTEIGLMAALNPKAIPGVTDLESLLEHARRHPGRVDYASSGKGTTSHLAGRFFAALTGTTLSHIPYRGGAAAMLDVLAGRVPFMIDVAPNVMPHVASGRLVALGVSTTARLPSAPDVPTLEEAGVAGFRLSAWDGFVLPKGTDASTVERFNAALNAALADVRLQKRLFGRGAEVRPGSAEDFQRFIAEEAPKWSRLVREIRAEEAV